MHKISGARAVVEVFKEEGVKHVFHLPGSKIIDVMMTKEALEKPSFVKG